jgi:hypothetical protein
MITVVFANPDGGLTADGGTSTMTAKVSELDLLNGNLATVPPGVNFLNLWGGENYYSDQYLDLKTVAILPGEFLGQPAAAQTYPDGGPSPIPPADPSPNAMGQFKDFTADARTWANSTTNDTCSVVSLDGGNTALTPTTSVSDVAAAGATIGDNLATVTTDTVTYQISNLLVLSRAQQNGDLISATVDYSSPQCNGGTPTKYTVIGTYPATTCGNDFDCSPCPQDASLLTSNGSIFGAPMNLSFPAKCVNGYCQVPGPFPNLLASPLNCTITY